MARAKVYFNKDGRTTYDSGVRLVLGESYVQLYTSSGEKISYPVRNVVKTSESE